MGTRSGDIDPAILFYLSQEHGYTLDQLNTLLNRESGLLGICGQNDMRQIHTMIEAGHADATLALEMFVYRIKKYIGAYYAILGRVDALVFTGGIGENDEVTRALILEGLPFELPHLVIETDEELAIALEAKRRIEELKTATP